jgi:hypothetical protein
MEILDIERGLGYEPLEDYEPTKVCPTCWQLRSLKGTCACL